MAVEVDLALNSRKFQAGTKDAEKALEKLSDVMDDFAKDATDAGEDGADGLEELGDAARKAEGKFRDLTDETKKVDREIDKAGDAARDFGRDADRAGDTAKRGFKKAEEGVEEFKDEANSTAREAAASFDGSAESIGDAFQEVAANAFAGFGPAGAVAGIAAAAGIGLAVAAFEGVNEASEESKERAAEWGQAFIEAGDTVLSAAARQAMAMDILGDPERYQQLQDNAREWGVSTATALAAMTGEAWALEAAEDALAEREREVAEATADHTTAGEGLVGAMSDQAVETRNGRDALNELNREIDDGITLADTYSQYLVDMANNTEGTTRKVDEFGDSIYELPDGTTVYVDAETGRATRNIEDVENQVYGLPDGHVRVTADTTQAQRTLSAWTGRTLTKRVVVHMMTRAGMSIPV